MNAVKIKSHTLILIVVMVALCGIIYYRYDQYLTKKNFLVDANVPCNPSTETCFVSDCTPDTDPECDTSTYKKIKILASDAPLCVLEHTCENFSCGNIASCTETQCNQDSLGDGEVCYIPSSDSENK